MKTKKFYEKPELEAIEFTTQDICVSSKQEDVPEEVLKAAAGATSCFSSGTACGTNPVKGCTFTGNNLTGGTCKNTKITLDGIEISVGQYLYDCGVRKDGVYEVTKVENGIVYFKQIG